MNVWKRVLPEIVLALAGMCLALLTTPSAHAAPPLAPRLPEAVHGLHYTTPAMVWDEALPLGNGCLGALVWGDGRPMRISLDRNDLWDTRPVPEFHSPEYSYELMCRWHDEGRTQDLIRVYEDPYRRAAPTKIPAGRIELIFGGNSLFTEAFLPIADPVAETRFSGGAFVRVMVHAIEPVGMITVRSSAPPAVRLVAPPFSGAPKGASDRETNTSDLALLSYPAPVRADGVAWQAFTQEGAEGFRFAIFMGWRERKGEWLAAWSIATNREGTDPLRIARERAERALLAGFDRMEQSHRAWWETYWRKSSVRLPNPVLERQWYLEQYKFGAASRRGHPPITLQAVWTADNEQIPPWKGDYHHDLNTQLSYWPCYAGNHLEEGMSYLDWLWDTRENCRDWTQRFFRLPGLNVPMTGDLNNSQIGGWRQYTHSATTAAWLAQHFYLHWKYSGDRRFLRERAYPYLREAAVFLEAITARKGPDGFRTIPLSASPEYYDNRPEAWFKTFTNYDLALIRWLFAATAELADELKLPGDAARWRAVLAEFPDFYLADTGALLLTKDHPVKESHRHFSHLMAIHPLGLIDWSDGDDARRTIRASLADLDRLGTDLWCGYSFAWLGSIAARALDGAKAERALELFSTAFTLRNSFHCNGDQSGKGYSKFTYRPFTLEGNFAAAAGIQEMLLKSHRGKILVFPALPESWKDASFTTLRAQGAFLVSAVRRNGKTERVEITSERGGRCVLVSPFSGRELVFSMSAGERRILTKDPAER